MGELLSVCLIGVSYTHSKYFWERILGKLISVLNFSKLSCWLIAVSSLFSFGITFGENFLGIFRISSLSNSVNISAIFLALKYWKKAFFLEFNVFFQSIDICCLILFALVPILPFLILRFSPPWNWIAVKTGRALNINFEHIFHNLFLTYISSGLVWMYRESTSYDRYSLFGNNSSCWSNIFGNFCVFLMMLSFHYIRLSNILQLIRQHCTCMCHIVGWWYRISNYLELCLQYSSVHAFCGTINFAIFPN